MTKIEAGALGHEPRADLEMLGQSVYVLFSLGHLPSTQATGDLSPPQRPTILFCELAFSKTSQQRVPLLSHWKEG